MSENSPRLNMPYIQPSQAQKHVTHNEAIEVLDAIVHLRLEEIGVNDPPTSPNEGMAWGISDAPTGAWGGEQGKIASWRNNGWLFIDPMDGWVAWHSNANKLYVRSSGEWEVLTAEAELQNLDGVGINATSDPTNPLSVSGAATLLNHAGSGHQLKLNKATATDTTSILFQTDFVGRAEFGLSGSNELSAKISSDGSNWTDLMTLSEDRSTFSRMMNLNPQAQPLSAVAGDIYFDIATNKLRCFDGSLWNDLF